jgi:transposase
MSAASNIAPTLTHIGVGIDTARYGHRVAFLRPDRQPAAKPLTVLENREGYQALQTQLESLHRQHPHAQLNVRIDAAGQYATNLEGFLRQLKQLPLVISVGEPKRNKDYQKAHFPKRTTDDTESQAMARFAVVELPAATRASTAAMDLLREVAGRLQAQVKQSTQAINRFHNLLARVFPELATLTADLAAGWVLHLCDRYPSAQRIAQAHRSSLEAIPFMPQDKVELLHQAAKQSVGSLKGAVAETLVRELVAQVRNAERAEHNLRELLVTAYADLPSAGHRQLITICGFGEATAAILTAKIVDINRFATPAQLVGYFGVFPEENTSGVDKRGKPLPAGTLQMSNKGNDLVRAYLWNATKSALQHNPAVRALYVRLRAKNKRGDVAFGHCMRKLLHLAYAVWKTDRPFNKQHYPWEKPTGDAPTTPTAAGPSPAAATTPNALPPLAPVVTEPTVSPTSQTPPASLAAPERTNAATPLDSLTVAPAPAAVSEYRAAAAVAVPTSAPASAAAPVVCEEVVLPVARNKKKAGGHKRDVPAAKVVTPATASVESSAPLVNPPARPGCAADRPGPLLDFAYLRSQITIEAVLSYLGILAGLRGSEQQRRGVCPLHGRPEDRNHTFSVHLGKNIFRCFDSGCGAQGNVLDLWAAMKQLPLYEAAQELATTFKLKRNREEEPVN